MKTISVVIPVYNEEENVREAYAQVKRILEGLAGRYDHEIVFTDNHSADGGFALLREIARGDPKVKVARFSRNVGYQRSIHAGYCLSTGDAVVQLDCDLQDPPGLIPEFVRKWEEGFAVAYGVRRTRTEGFLITAARKGFYRLINLLSEDRLPFDAGDFRLVDRRIVKELKAVYDCSPYLRGFIASAGFAQAAVPYDRAGRARGESKFGLRALVQLAVDGILNHSVVPLRFASVTGVFVFFAALALMAGYVTFKAVLHRPWPAGFTTVTILILVSLSLNALFLGVIGEYLGRIYQQVKRRPLVLVEETINL